MVTVKKSINKLNEAGFLLHSLTQNFKYDEYKKGLETSCFDEQKYNKMLDKYVQIYKKIETTLDVSKEKIDFYFKPIDENNVCIADFVMLYEFHNYNETLEENILRVKNLSDDDRLLEYAKILTEYHTQGNIEDAKKIHSLADILNVLNESDLSAENKLALLNIYCNKEKYLDEVAGILSKTIAIIDEYSEEFKFIEEFFYEYWSEFVEGIDIIERIETILNIEWNRNPSGLVIIPTFFSPNMVTISIVDEDIASEDVLRIGFLVDENFRQRKKASNIEDIGNIMKVFSDKSKLDILNMIKNKPAYGKELADGLGLAKGTISHHMSSLMGIGVIDTLCESNKIYYSLNKKKFGEILDELKEYFIESSIS
jgi:DNA-binding transcriptional ArsR family regulator